MNVKNPAIRVSKKDWYAAGGLANPQCFRKADTRGAWRYYRLIRNPS